MKEIIKLILKYHFTIIFILLEVVSFSLIVQHNDYQRTIFSGQTSSFFCYVSSYTTDLQNYFWLKDQNELLVIENTSLKNKVEELKTQLHHSGIQDTTPLNVTYKYISAQTINATFNKTKNYITLDKGSDDGLEPEMAVCSREGVVGIVKNVNNHNAVVQPLINTNQKLSAKVKKNGYFGSLQWDGNDARYSYLNDIAFHVSVAPGDTIVTSGFSSIFPEGELVGFVESVENKAANFLTIKIRLAVDYRKIADVYVITNRDREETRKLESLSDDE